MPIYEYTCTKCRHGLEAIQKFSDPPLTKCPDCGGRLEKQMSASAFHLKGSGWYKDGYASTKLESDSKSEGAKKEGKPTENGTDKSDVKEKDKKDTKDVASDKKETPKEDSKRESAPAAKASARPSPSATRAPVSRAPVQPPKKKKPGPAPAKTSRRRSKK
jgi:putative FmdB family regulatory protein